MSKQRLGQAFVSTGSTTRGSSRSAADCIGRVGGLAAALGVGAMLFVAPWTAAAQTEGSSGTSESSEAGSPTDSESAGRNGSNGDSVDSETSGATDDDDDSESENLDSELSDELDAELSDELDSALDDELDAELSDEPDSDLSDEPDSEVDAAETDGLGEAGGASSSGADDVEVVPEDDGIADEVAEDVPSDSGSGTVGAGAAAPVVTADEPQPVVEPAAPDSIETVPASAEATEAAVVEPLTARSSYTSASVMSVRTTTAEAPSEPPAKALQAQPGTFLEVASSMLSAVIAPFVTTPAAPAAPSAQPLMWGVLSWVRRELEDTFANFSISIGGRQIVQNGTAYATSEGFGSFAIAHGENAVASASGLFNVAIVRGDDSTATSEGNFTRVRVRGDDNTAGADGAGSRTSIYGDQNTAETTGAYSSLYVRGVGNEATGTGDGNRATVYGDGNEVVLASQDGPARARVVGDRNTATAASDDGRTRVSVVGDDNDATALATDGSRAEITVRGDENSAAASADEDSTARASIIGDTSSAVATANLDGYAAARITGDSNVASSDALGETSIARITGDDSAASATAAEARAEATTYGDGNAAEANDGKAVISGDGSIADADGPGSVARVWGDGSTASALGEQNTAFVWGNESRAIAGPGIYNNALVFGNNLLADTGPGDGRTVYGQPFDPENQAPVAGAPGAQTVDPQTGTVTGTLGFTDPDGDTLTYTATDPTNGSVTINAQAGTYTYTPATRPDFGEPDDADAFTVTATDPAGLSASTTIDVPVTALPEPGNQAPQAGTPGEQTVDPETGTVTGTLGFTDPDGDPLTYEVTEQPDNGVVTVDNEAGTYTYTPETRPEPGQPDGEDSFTVVASDPDGLTATNTVGLPIVALPEPDNQAPVAGTPGEQTVNPETGSVTATFSYTDPDGDDLTYTVSTPANGTVTLDAQTGTYTYTPDPEARPAFGQEDGVDAFTLTASDGQASSTIGIEVPVTALPEPDNQAPVAAGDAATVTEDSTTNIIDVLANDTDADGDSLTVTAVSTPTHGTAAVSGDGLSVTYTPDANFNGSDTFTYTVTDTAGGTGTATVSVTVTAVDDPASLGNDTATVAENSGATTINVLANDSDVDGALTVTEVSTAANGTAAVSGDGLSVTYTPDANFNGSDTFTYTVTDTAGGTGTATVSVTVTAVNDGPPVLVGLNEIPGDPARQPQIGPDGTAYQVVVFGFGTSDQRTSVYAVNSDGSVDLNNPVVDMAPGGPDSRLAFAPERYAYQTTFDYINQVGNVLVIDLDNPGSYVRVPVGSDRLFDSELSVSPDGKAYVLPSNTFSPTLTIIDPEDPTATTPVVLTGITPEGPVVFNQLDGTPYVAVEINDPDDMVQLYEIDIASPDDPLTLVAESTGQLANDGVVAAPNGAVYVTIPTVSTDGMSFVTHVVMIDPGDPGTPVQFDLDGTTVLSVVIGPDGTAYQAVEEITSDGVNPSTIAATTRISVLDPANADNPVTVEIPGQLGQQMVVGSNGTIYGLVTVTDFSGFPNTVTTYQLVAINPENPSAAVTVDLEGEPTDFAVGDDGRATVISQTEAEVGGETVYTTHVRIIDPDDPANPILVDLAGNAVDVAVNPDGYVFVNTETLEAVGFVTHLSVIDPDNAADPILATYDIDGPSSFQAGAVVGPDGTVYLSTVGPDVNTETTNVAVIGSGSVVSNMSVV